MKKTMILCMMIMLALGVSAQSKKKATKGKKATSCTVCKGKGYLTCPRCDGEVEIYDSDDDNYYLCDMCTVNTSGILSSSSAAYRFLESTKIDVGNVKCPYCKTKSKKPHRTVSREDYEAEKN